MSTTLHLRDVDEPRRPVSGRTDARRTRPSRRAGGVPGCRVTLACG